MTCLNPKFEYDADKGWWKWCSECGRAAWSHEQSDPLADMRNILTGVRAAPVMQAPEEAA